MAEVTCVLRNGTAYCGPLWAWRPQDGWFSLVLDEPNPPDRIWLRDCVTAVNHGERVGVFDRETGVPKIEDVDLLERARREGWDGI